jgi:hypothetical protein
MLIAALIVAPAALSAQGTTADAQTRAEQEARVTSPRIPEGFSADTRIRLTALLEAARRQNLPEEPMTDRMAEGQAKGAGEDQIVAATARMLAELKASHSALVRAGQGNPSEEEVTRGAQAISLRQDVALDVLLGLAARGLPVDRALAALEAGGSASTGIRVSLGGRKP